MTWKIRPSLNQRGVYLHSCPGCGMTHQLRSQEALDSGLKWEFNNDVSAPTFTPSFGHSWPNRRTGVDNVCHYNMNAGFLTFHKDSTHKLAGNVVEMPDIEAEPAC